MDLRVALAGAGILILSATARTACGAPPAQRSIAPGLGTLLLTGGPADGLAGTLRGHLVRSLPTPLYESSAGWGRQAKGPGGKLKNDGTWRKLRVTAERPADTLVFDLRDVRAVEPGKVGFTAFVAFDARVEHERQVWRSGVRLYAGSVRARVRIRLALACEVSARLEPGGLLLPDAVIRLHVARSELGFDNLVVEHVAGIGGEGAKLLGDAAKGALRHSSLERDLLARANAAILKAGEAK